MKISLFKHKTGKLVHTTSSDFKNNMIENSDFEYLTDIVGHNLRINGSVSYTDWQIAHKV